MGLFTPNGNNVYSEPFDIENMTFEECAYENPFEAASYIVAESENNYNSIMKAIALDELAVYESTGVEMVYEAVNFRAFFAKVKEFFKKLWEKIKGMFQKFFAKINSVVMKDKEFVKKYKKAILDADTKGFEYKGFTFTNLDAKIKSADQIEAAGLKTLSNISGIDKEALISYSESISGDSKTDLLDKFRGSLVGASKVEEADFSAELFKYFRNGEDTKDDIDTVDKSKFLDIIGSTADTKKKAENDLRDLKKTIDNIIKELEKAEKAAYDDKEAASERVNAFSKTIEVIKARMNLVTVWSGAKLKALKDQNAQCKSVCVKLLTYKPKNESAGFVHTEGGSYLDSVVFK